MRKSDKNMIKLASLGGIAGIGLFLVFFGTSILTNLHNKFIRAQGKHVILLHNSEGGGATGFIIKAKSGRMVVMTNNHVCGIAENGAILGDYRGDTYILKVIKSYPMNDLCALEAPNTATSSLSTALYVKTGETVYMVGHPLLDPLSVRSGELSGLVKISIAVKVNPGPEECTGLTYRLIDTSQTIYAFFGVNSICIRELQADSGSIDSLPGNSGSPMLNIYGNVVGVLFAGHESGTRSYSVPLFDLKAFLRDL